MIILGIIFLAYDTFSDKTIRNKHKGHNHERGSSSTGRSASKTKKKH
jgi:hypothetical protein